MVSRPYRPLTFRLRKPRLFAWAEEFCTFGAGNGRTGTNEEGLEWVALDGIGRDSCLSGEAPRKDPQDA